MILRNRAKTFLTERDVRALTVKSDLRGLLELAGVWATVCATLALPLVLPHPVTIVAAVLYLGGRQLALAVLMHEATHYTFMKTKRANDFFGQWFAAGPALQNLTLYRQHHLRHHRYVGTKNDPDLRLAAGFPVSRPSMTRKLLRDLIGVTGVRALLGTFLMLSGWARYDVSGVYERADHAGHTLSQLARRAVSGLAPALVANAAMFALMALAGAAWLYLLWIAAFLTSYQVALRIRSIGEHAMTGDPRSALTVARTTRARWWERALFAPLNVSYHIEHHMLAAVPFYRLPAMHELLRKRGAFDRDACVAHGYAQVLSAACDMPTNTRRSPT